MASVTDTGAGRICPVCAHRGRPGDRFCERCGSVLLDASAALSGESGTQRSVTRRDVLVAGVGGLVGVATGALGTVVTTYVQDRARAGLASGNLVVYPDVQWVVAGAWTFYANSPIDLTSQPVIQNGQDDDRLVAYLIKQGCIRRSPLLVTVHMSRPGDSPAVIRSITLENHRQAPPVVGAEYLSESAGASDNAIYALNLDQHDSRFVRTTLSSLGDLENATRGQPDAFAASTFSVAPHTTESMTLAFHAARFMHEFSLKIHYFVEGREHSVDVDLAGLPFQVSPGVDNVREKYCVPWYNQIYNLVPCRS